jgi:hypothetical protein
MPRKALPIPRQQSTMRRQKTSNIPSTGMGCTATSHYVENLNSSGKQVKIAHRLLGYSRHYNFGNFAMLFCIAP